jgi:hypothetical protein
MSPQWYDYPPWSERRCAACRIVLRQILDSRKHTTTQQGIASNSPPDGWEAATILISDFQQEAANDERLKDLNIHTYRNFIDCALYRFIRRLQELSVESGISGLTALADPTIDSLLKVEDPAEQFSYPKVNTKTCSLPLKDYYHPSLRLCTDYGKYIL